MNLKEHYKNYLMKSVMESVKYDEHGEFGSTGARRYAGRGNWEPTTLRRHSIGDIFDRDFGLAPSPHTPSHTPSRETAAAQQAAEKAAAMAEQIRVGNLLNAVHHYSRNFGISLKPEHIQGIDFSTGSLDDHIDQISARLPPIR